MFFKDFEVSEVPSEIFIPPYLYERPHSGAQMLKNINLNTMISSNSALCFDI